MILSTVRILSACMFSILMVLFIFSSEQVEAKDELKTIVELERKVQHLEKRVVKLEALLLQREHSGSPSKPVLSGDWRTTANWRSLQKGMTKQEVKQFLGEPPNVWAKSYGDTWFYPDLSGGQVQFDGSDRLEGWNEP